MFKLASDGHSRQLAECKALYLPGLPKRPVQISTERLLQAKLGIAYIHCSISRSEEYGMVRIRSSQKFFTEDEVASLTGICLDHLRKLARNRHLGTLARAAEAAEAEAGKWLFTNSDLMILTVLHPRCEH
jgi:hypothetical protein